MIGVVVPDLIISFFAELILGVSKKLRARGYEVVVANSEENAQLEMDEVDRLVGRRVDGLIIASSQPFGSPSLFRELASRNVPFLLVDRDFPDIGANFVGCDNEQIGQLATRHLVEAGCLRIAHLRGPETATGVGRDSGYRRVLQEAGLAYRPELVVSAGSSDTSGYSAMQKLLAGHASPDGVFGYNDLVAAGALKAILEGGLKVPENVAIIGAGNHRLSNLLLVPLSTIDQKAATMGVKAAELMLKLIEPGRAPKNRRITIPAELVIRQSTRVSRRPVRINQ